MDLVSALPRQPQAPETVQPRECSLDAPSVFVQTASVRRLRLGQVRANGPLTQCLVDRFAVVGLVSIQTARSSTRPRALAVHRRHVVEHRPQLRGVVPVRVARSRGERNGTSLDQHMMLGAPATATGRAFPCFFAFFQRPNGRAIEEDPAPPQLAPSLQLRQQRGRQLFPDALLLSAPDPSPTGGSRASEVSREEAPGNARLQHKDESFPGAPIVDGGRLRFCPGERFGGSGFRIRRHSESIICSVSIVRRPVKVTLPFQPTVL